MLSFYNIWTVTRYELKTLLRSWFFRIFAGITITILILMTVFPLIKGYFPYAFRALSSSIPFLNIKLLSLVQTIIAIFLAADFLKRDRKADSTEVFYARSMTNADYILGKTSGVFIVFLLLDGFHVLISGFLHLFFAGAPFSFLPYIYYLLFYSFSTLIFMVGLTLIIMSLVRNQAVTFVLSLAIVGVVLFYLGDKFYGVFDFLGFSLPAAYSDFVGLSLPTAVILQRLAYTFFGFSFIFATILMLKRLVQSKAMNRMSGGLALAFFILAAFCLSFYYQSFTRTEQARIEQKELNKKFSNLPAVTIEHIDLKLVHLGQEIRSEAHVVFKNNNPVPLTSYLFSLNPGLSLTKITAGNNKLSFTREGQYIQISPQAPLTPTSVDSLVIHYQGRIDEKCMYLEVDDEKHSAPIRFWLVNIQKRYALIENDYLLLTPESQWYPIAGALYGANYPNLGKQDFINFSLSVETEAHLTALSQGERQVKKLPESNQTRHSFIASQPYPGLSLIIGEYEKREVVADSIHYSLWIKPNHDYFEPFFDEIGDTLVALIIDAKNEFENVIGFSYPYRRLSLIETPVQFTCYQRPWTLARENVQPEMVLLPEYGIFCDATNFKQMSDRSGQRQQRRGQTYTEQENQAQMFESFINSNFTGLSRSRFFFLQLMGLESIDYKIFPLYFSRTNHFFSEQWPIFNLALESFIQSRIPEIVSSFVRAMEGLSIPEKVNRILDGSNLEAALADTALSVSSQDIIRYKGTHLFLELQHQLGEREFNSFLNEFLSTHRNADLEVDDFIAAFQQYFDIDFRPYFKTWYADTLLPGYLISDIQSELIMDKEHSRFQTSFIIENPEPKDGLVKVSFYSGGRGRSFRGRPTTASDIRLIKVNAKQRKKVGIVLDEPARRMEINTLVSKNIPVLFSRYFQQDEEINKKAKPFDGEEILSTEKALEQLEIVVDNEDSNFQIIVDGQESLLQKIVRPPENEDTKYGGVFYWKPPGKWKATTDDSFFGKYIHSAHVIKGGNGEQKVAWNAQIVEPGQYEIYYYPGQPETRWIFRRRRNRSKREKGILHFEIYHDDGTEPAELDLNSTSVEWSYLGSFYFSQGNAQVVLSNETKAAIVFADAVKWVKK